MEQEFYLPNIEIPSSYITGDSYMSRLQGRID